MTMCGDPIQSTLDAQGQGQLEYRGLVQSTPEVQGHSECGNLHEGGGGGPRTIHSCRGKATVICMYIVQACPSINQKTEVTSLGRSLFCLSSIKLLLTSQCGCLLRLLLWGHIMGKMYYDHQAAAVGTEAAAAVWGGCIVTKQMFGTLL